MGLDKRWLGVVSRWDARGQIVFAGTAFCCRWAVARADRPTTCTAVATRYDVFYGCVVQVERLVVQHLLYVPRRGILW